MMAVRETTQQARPVIFVLLALGCVAIGQLITGGTEYFLGVLIGMLALHLVKYGTGQYK